MTRSWFLPAFLTIVLAAASPACAAGAGDLASHKAIYDIDLTATHSGSQVLDITGKMDYATRYACDAWMTDHHFKLAYQYADGPGMRISSDFSTFESGDGRDMQFSSRRVRDGSMYQEIRGAADRKEDGTGKAVYSMPEGVKYDLTKGTLFPAVHTAELVKHAKAGDKFFSAIVFDGSDEKGPLEINAFIGKQVKGPAPSGDKIDGSLLKNRAWNVRMAVFPEKDDSEESDYEMSMVLHENGIISDMVIDYDEFTVTQKLVSLEALPADECAKGAAAPKR